MGCATLAYGALLWSHAACSAQKYRAKVAARQTGGEDRRRYFRMLLGGAHAQRPIQLER
jgi:hypothetical protein